MPEHRFVAVTGEDSALGWVACIPVSDRCVYAEVVEHSGYVSPDAHSVSVGRALRDALLASTESAGVWTIPSTMFPESAASDALYRLLLAVVVTMPGIQDRHAAHRLTALRAKFSGIELVWADGGYAGRLVRWASHVLALAVQVVKRSDDTTGFHVLPRRWVVERTFAWLSRCRRCVRDYETRPDHHEAMIYIAMIMSRRLAR